MKVSLKHNAKTGIASLCFLFVCLSLHSQSAGRQTETSILPPDYAVAVRRAIAAGRKVSRLARESYGRDANYKDSLAEAKAEIQGTVGIPGAHLGINVHLVSASLNMELGNALFFLGDRSDAFKKSWEKIEGLLAGAERLLNALITGAPTSREHVETPVFPGASTSANPQAKKEQELGNKVGVDVSYARKIKFYVVRASFEQVRSYYRNNLAGFSEKQFKCGNSFCTSFEKSLGNFVSQIIRLQDSEDGTRIEIGEIGDLTAQQANP